MTFLTGGLTESPRMTEGRPLGISRWRRRVRVDSGDKKKRYGCQNDNKRKESRAGPVVITTECTLIGSGPIIRRDRRDRGRYRDPSAPVALPLRIQGQVTRRCFGGSTALPIVLVSVPNQMQLFASS